MSDAAGTGGLAVDAATAGLGAPEAPARQALLPLAVLVAGASAASGAIHVAFAPEHFGESWRHGLFFALAGLAQIAWAGAVVARPSRRVIVAGVAQIGIVGVWVVSRTIGIPIGSPAEGVAFPDSLATALEVVIVAVGVRAARRGRAARPTVDAVSGEPGVQSGAAATIPSGFASRRLGPRRALAGALAVVAVVGGLTVVSLTPRYAGAHAHGAGHAHTAAEGHVHGTTAGLLDGSTPCERSGPPASTAQTTVEGHDHRGPLAQQVLDEATRDALTAQQVEARAAAAKYPTVADAEAAGYRLSTPYVPCIGAHYTNGRLIFRFDPSAPSELLYDGTRPDSKLVGLSYLVHHAGGPPAGFAGPNDLWHQHNFNGGLCFEASGVVVGGETLTPEECSALGGHKQQLVDIWMVHDWVVPGWECSWGVFAAECPELGGRAGGTAWDPPATTPPSAGLQGTAAGPAG